MTLVEVMVALVIGSVCVTLSSFIFMRLNGDRSPFQQLKALTIAEHHMNNMMKGIDSGEEPVLIGDFHVRHYSARHEEYTDRKVVRVVVFDQKLNNVCEIEKVIPITIWQ